ncbi:hypothetical protein ACQUW0_26205, partial [Ralstonia pseudosolanacearum]|uniref:hypothetical protein n=1 Tax=Ralstonia pseudosolanacearum TaxID=1310165 RepID=UPI003D180EFA
TVTVGVVCGLVQITVDLAWPVQDLFKLGHCWKYALEAIIKWLLSYFLVHDNGLLFMLELY